MTASIPPQSVIRNVFLNGKIPELAGKIPGGSRCGAARSPNVRAILENLWGRTKLSENQLGLIELRKPNTTAWRTLEKPIRMDTNAIYYLSFYIQKKNSVTTGKSEQFGNLSLQTSAESDHPHRILFGMSSKNYATLQAGMQIIESAPPLQTGKTYFFVAKIVASEKASDQVFLRAYSEAETIPEVEPPVWTNTTTPFQDSHIFDLVRIKVGRKGDFLFDELRIGTTWASVVHPDLPRLVLEKQ